MSANSIEDKIRAQLRRGVLPYRLREIYQSYRSKLDQVTTIEERLELEQKIRRALDYLDPSTIAERTRLKYHVVSKERLVETIFSNIITGLVETDYIGLSWHPIPLDYNLDRITNAQNRGLILCHGHSHAAPIIPDFIPVTVQWEMVDLDPDTDPDFVVNLMDWNQVSTLRYVQYSLSHFCPFSSLANLVAYIYCLRQISVPGGLIMIHSLPAIGEIDRLHLDLTLSEILILYRRFLNLIVAYCGCSGIDLYHKGSEPWIEYRDNQIIDNLILILRI